MTARTAATEKNGRETGHRTRLSAPSSAFGPHRTSADGPRSSSSDPPRQAVLRRCGGGRAARRELQSARGSWAAPHRRGEGRGTAHLSERGPRHELPGLAPPFPVALAETRRRSAGRGGNARPRLLAPLLAPRGWGPRSSSSRSSLLPRADGAARRSPAPRSQPARRAPRPALLSPGAECARPPHSWKRSLHWLRPGALANQEAAIMEEGNKYKMAARIKPGIGLRPGDGGIEALTRAPRAARRRRLDRRRLFGRSEPPTAIDHSRAQPLPAEPRRGRGRARRTRGPQLGPTPSPLPPRRRSPARRPAARLPPGTAPGGHGRLQVGRSREGREKEARAPRLSVCPSLGVGALRRAAPRFPRSPRRPRGAAPLGSGLAGVGVLPGPESPAPGQPSLSHICLPPQPPPPLLPSGSGLCPGSLHPAAAG